MLIILTDTNYNVLDNIIITMHYLCECAVAGGHQLNGDVFSFPGSFIRRSDLEIWLNESVPEREQSSLNHFKTSKVLNELTTPRTQLQVSTTVQKSSRDLLKAQRNNWKSLFEGNFVRIQLKQLDQFNVVIVNSTFSNS